VVRRAQERVIGSLQARFVELVRTGSYSEPIEIEPQQPTPSMPLQQASSAAIPSAALVMARSGRLCTAWLAASPVERGHPARSDVLARLLSTRAALIEARAALAPDRWRLLYAPKLEILDNDILPRFPSELRVAALASRLRFSRRSNEDPLATSLHRRTGQRSRYRH